METEKTKTTTCSSNQVSEMEEDTTTSKMDSPTNSQQTSSFFFSYSFYSPLIFTVSDDDEIDYSIKPEFYDPNLDDKDELWVQSKRKGRVSDAVLSCPACFTTLCLECQRDSILLRSIIEKSVMRLKRAFLLAIKLSLIGFCRHEKYVTQYRAIFVANCKIEDGKVRQERVKPKRGKRRRETVEGEAVAAAGGETFKSVHCSACTTEVGVIDEDEVYHFFNVLPSES
ncbi:hypothetical protein Golax_000453 [Gossypium laxum]|uniref:E2F-associated phosphoprotein n=1 Tax=Gossypium laxum TaxID=34288 RepID=A0A7J9ATU5_9ROSI|nr:hypothetical protein [Gossypium laxum]